MTDLAVHFEGVGKEYPHFTLDDIHLELPTGASWASSARTAPGSRRRSGSSWDSCTRTAARCASSAIRCPRNRRRPSATSASSPRTCGSTRRRRSRWHMEFIRSIYPGWDPAYAEQLLQRFDLRAAAEDQRALARAARQGGAPARPGPAPAPARARRADHRPRSGGAPGGARRADGGARRRAAHDLLLVAEHARRRADLRPDHLHRSRTDHRLGRQGDVSRALAPRAPRRAARASCCPSLPGIVDAAGSGRLTVMTTSRYDPAMTARLSGRGRHRARRGHHDPRRDLRRRSA